MAGVWKRLPRPSKKAKKTSKQRPKKIITDRLKSYEGPVFTEYLERGKPLPEHIRSPGLMARMHNNRIK